MLHKCIMPKRGLWISDARNKVFFDVVLSLEHWKFSFSNFECKVIKCLKNINNLSMVDEVSSCVITPRWTSPHRHFSIIIVSSILFLWQLFFFYYSFYNVFLKEYYITLHSLCWGSSDEFVFYNLLYFHRLQQCFHFHFWSFSKVICQ